MKKVLLFILGCVVIGKLGAMEQSVDLGYILETLSSENQIACWLDAKSFSSFTRVCSLFEAICNQIPLKYLAIDFSDAAEHKNKNLISRFIARSDECMFEPGIGQEVFCKENENDTIKIFKRSIGKGLQSFLGDCSFYCINQADTIVRCFWCWKSPELFENKHEAAHCTYFNIVECNDAINIATTEFLSCACCPIKNTHIFNWTGSVYWLHNTSMRCRSGDGMDKFGLPVTVNPIENFVKQFEMLMLLIIAAQKNSTAAVSVIINSSLLPESWIQGLIEDRVSYFLPAYHDKHNYEEVWRVLAKLLGLKFGPCTV